MTSDQPTQSSVEVTFAATELYDCLGRSTDFIERSEIMLWMVAIAALIMDITITYYGLERGFTELNPVAAYAIDLYGYTAMFWLKGLAVIVAISGRQLIPEQWHLLIPALIAVPWTVGAFLNLFLITAP